MSAADQFAEADVSVLVPFKTPSEPELRTVFDVPPLASLPFVVDTNQVVDTFLAPDLFRSEHSEIK
jgi:hypothetical protein